MAGGFPYTPELCNGQTVGANTGTSNGTDITTSSSANTKGSWTQLVASLACDAEYIAINGYWRAFSASLAVGSIDLGVGAAASEKIVVADYVITNNTGNNNGASSLIIPISIPAGSRVAARSQCSLASALGLNLTCQMYDSGFTAHSGSAGVDAIGYSPSTSMGVAVTASGSTNTKGSYSQITAATVNDYVGIFGVIDNQASNTANGAGFLFDVAIGAGGSEVVIIPNIFTIRGNNTAPSPTSFQFTPIPIPAGTRLAARCQCSTASAVIGLTLYGVYE